MAVFKPLGVIITLSALVTVSRAQGPGRASPLFTAVALFETLDKDRDGFLSPSEIDAAPSLRALDQSGDGLLSAEELRPSFARGGPGGGFPGGGRGRRGPEGEPGGGQPAVSADLLKTLMDLDANADGKLSKSEVPERLQGLFQRGDKDKDGALSQAELKALAEAPPPASNRAGAARGQDGRTAPLASVPFLSAIDMDSSGTLSLGEITVAPAAIRTLDKDGDGRVSRDEAGLSFPGRGRGR